MNIIWAYVNIYLYNNYLSIFGKLGTASKRKHFYSFTYYYTNIHKMHIFVRANITLNKNCLKHRDRNHIGSVVEIVKSLRPASTACRCNRHYPSFN